MKKKNYRFIVLAVMATLLMAWPSVSSANYLDFTITDVQEGATISYAGGITPLIGTNINVTKVSNFSDDGKLLASLAITNGKLNFTTGNNVNNINPGNENWIFGGGGTITITGSISGVTTNSTLLSGSFVSLSEVIVVDTITKFKTVVAAISDTKNSELATYFGYTNTVWEGTINETFSIAKTIHAPNGFVSLTVASGDVTNTPVPLPAAFLLFGSGLFGMVCVRRRKI